MSFWLVRIYVNGVKWSLVRPSRYRSKEFRKVARMHNRKQIRRLFRSATFKWFRYYYLSFAEAEGIRRVK